MIFDYFDSLIRIFDEFDSIWSAFGDARSLTENVLSQVRTLDLTGSLSQYFGTIRYVAGDTIYVTLITSLQLAMFLILVKAMYQLIKIVMNSFAIQKPLSIIKTFLKL